MAKKKVRKLSAAQGQKRPEAPPAGSDAQKGASESAVTAPALGPVARFVEYLKDVKVEFGKVTWASKKDTIGLTVAVLAISIFFAAFLGMADIVLSKLIGLMLY